jgi:hypothetical protein
LPVMTRTRKQRIEQEHRARACIRSPRRSSRNAISSADLRHEHEARPDRRSRDQSLRKLRTAPGGSTPVDGVA